MRNLIKSNDQYGHKIGLNFNNNGQEFKTFLGGCVTIFVNSILIAYAVYRTSGMLNHTYDVINLQENIRHKE
jgi:hypothetical protein